MMPPLSICGSGLTDTEYYRLHLLAARRRAQGYLRRIKKIEAIQPREEWTPDERRSVAVSEKFDQHVIAVTKSPSWVRAASLEELSAVLNDLHKAEARHYREGLN
jgi:hypothetical protein